MKKIQILILVLLTTMCLGQGNPIGSLSQSTLKDTDSIINEGTANDNGSFTNALIVTYNGDILKLIIRLKQDLGREEVIRENAINRKIVFRKIVNPEWTEKRLNIGFSSISNGDRHIISITCTDNKKNDYLTPGTEIQRKIKAYLQSITVGG